MTLSEYEVRQAKVTALKSAGVVPYANRFERTHTIAELRTLAANYNMPDTELLMEEGAENTYSVAGRIVMFRSHGKLSFATIRDGSWDMQVAFVKDLCWLHTGHEVVWGITVEGQDVSAYKFAEKYLDVADFVGVRWELFMTKHGELTLFVHEYQLLSKALRPLGDKWHGVNDIETLYRQRYLDLTMNEPTYERFLLRSQFIQFLRQFYWEHGFIEIETPVLGSSASGAAAKPFMTHHNDFDEDFYLRIATEIWLKKATVGRFERVFEIGKQFRNEWSDPSHLQEFTSVEHYAVYWNFEDNMKFTQDMFAYLFAHLWISPQITVKDKEGVAKTVDFSGERQKIDYIEGVKRECGIDVTTYANDTDDANRLRNDIREKGVEFAGMNEMWTTTLIDYLYKKVLRPKILGPAFVYNYPKTMQPLARQSDKNPAIVEQFQLVVNGWEIIKAYSELVDPAVQMANFEEQADAQERGDEEATVSDDDFVLAMEHGMPPQSGRGLGIDRIITLLTQQDNLRDVILFPLVKPERNARVWDAKQETTHVVGEDVLAEPLIDLVAYGSLPSREAVQWAVDKYLTDTKKHCQQVWWVMQWFAKQLGQPEDLRWMAGVLHDIDRDMTWKDMHAHTGESLERIGEEIGLPGLLIEDIRSHYPEKHALPIDGLMRKYLISVDELSGFLYAYSRMRPNKFEGMDVAGVKKRLKDKSFAAWVHREHVLYCETYLGVSFDMFVPQVIEAMQQMPQELY